MPLQSNSEHCSNRPRSCESNAGMRVRSANEAVLVAGQIGFPVVMKIDSPDITHKSDVGGVRLGIANAQAAQDALARQQRNVQVEEHHVVALPAQQPVGGVAVGDFVDHELLLAQQARQPVRELDVVFDQQQLHRRCAREF